MEIEGGGEKKEKREKSGVQPNQEAFNLEQRRKLKRFKKIRRKFITNQERKREKRKSKLQQKKIANLKGLHQSIEERKEVYEKMADFQNKYGENKEKLAEPKTKKTLWSYILKDVVSMKENEKENRK